MKLLKILPLLFVFGCGSAIPETVNKIDYNTVKNQSSRINNKVENLNIIDTIVIKLGTNENEFNSMNGKFFLHKDTICFADNQLTKIFMYDSEGKYIKKTIQKGRGHNEILDISDISKTSDNGFVTVGTNWNIHIIDSSWIVNEGFRINPGLNVKLTINDMTNNPDPNNAWMYEIDFMSQTNIRYLNKNSLLVPIVTEHMNYNGVPSGANNDHFYKNSYTLGLIDINKKGIVELMINRPPLFTKKENRCIYNFSSILFDVKDENTIYYTFPADSLIYQFNLKNSDIISFGYLGKDMNTKYKPAKSFEEMESQNKMEFGHYNDLYLERNTNTLFRSFAHGKPKNGSGLQVYKDNVLIGEYIVPTKMSVIGYKEPYYYGAGGHNYMEGEMYIYKFKIQ